MNKHPLTIHTIPAIPAILWSPQTTPETQTLYLAIHGDQSHKEDAAITIFAQAAAARGHRTLSFDLPAHGDRQADPRPCKVQEATEDLTQILRYARTLAPKISLFACSIGAYFALQAYAKESLQKALFLSPLVDMQRMIENMMHWFDITPARLQDEQQIETPIQPLYWDYYQYVLSHPVEWHTPTAILCGENDTVVQRDTIDAFVQRTGASLTVQPGGEHYFHTAPQLAFFQSWAEESL